MLHSGKFGSRNWSGGPGLGGESDKANAMLVMRVLSIVPLNFKTEPWSGPMSRSLLVFNSFLSTLSRSLRALLEATTVNLLLREDARRHREDYLEIALSLPFRSDTNTAMGVLWKGWCDACSHVGHATGLGTREDLGGFVPRQGLSEEQVAQHRADLEGVKQDVSGMLEGAFGNVRDVRNELARGVRFWDTVSRKDSSPYPVEAVADTSLSPPRSWSRFACSIRTRRCCRRKCSRNLRAPTGESSASCVQATGSDNFHTAQMAPAVQAVSCGRAYRVQEREDRWHEDVYQAKPPGTSTAEANREKSTGRGNGRCITERG